MSITHCLTRTRRDLPLVDWTFARLGIILMADQTLVRQVIISLLRQTTSGVQEVQGLQGLRVLEQSKNVLMFPLMNRTMGRLIGNQS